MSLNTQSDDVESVNDSDSERSPLLISPINRLASRSNSFFSKRLKSFHRRLSTSSIRREDGESIFDTSATASQRVLGTFAGVFCPVALSMFSTMLFLRGGFVVGQAGLLETYAQLILAYFILGMTVLSICAISTNGAMEGGGAYYMISRALGPEFGGSIGFLFYVGQVLSCALYVVGFVEGILQNFGSFLTGGGDLPKDGDWWKYLYSTLSLFICLIICLIGGAMFARTSAIILLIVVVCTLSVIISVFAKDATITVGIPTSNHYIYPNVSGNNSVPINGSYTGLNLSTFRENLYSNYTVDYSTDNMMNFATVFSILFSSVTGILNGANMSGELRDPAKSIPRGTISAVCFTFSTYSILITLIAGSCSRFLLINDYIFLQQINLWKPFVVVGIFASTLSASLGNLIGGSRILQALGNDQLFWSLLKPATITTKGGNPLISVLITWFLCQIVLLVGKLNAIAPICSVFFLLAYASVNLACLALELASAPNFRPTFVYFSWHTCTLGIVGSMVMSFMITPVYTSISLVLMLILAIIIHFRTLPTTWASISQALIFHQVRKYLLMLDPRKSHIKFWRPQILLMVSNPRQSCELIDFCNDIKKSGLYVIGHVKVGKLDDFPTDPVLEETSLWLQLINHLKIKAFVELTLSSSVSDGFQQLVRLSGLGGMKVNTVCFGFYDDTMPTDSLIKTKIRKRKLFGPIDQSSQQDLESYFQLPRANGDRHLSVSEYISLIQDSLKLQKSVFLCRNFQLLNKDSIFKSGGKFFIDVWPVNFFRPDTASYFDNSCLFMLQLACILTMQSGWKKHAQLRVFLCVNSISENTAIKEKKLSTFLRQLRIQAKIVIVSFEHLLQFLIPDGDHYSATAPQTNEEDTDEVKMHEFVEVPQPYLEGVNTLLQNNLSQSAVTFLYLPRPPVAQSKYTAYLDQLSAISSWSHPTVFVHGLHAVTSTAL